MHITQANKNVGRTIAIGTFLAGGLATVLSSYYMLSTIQCNGYFIGANCINDPAALGAGFADNS